MIFDDGIVLHQSLHIDEAITPNECSSVDEGVVHDDCAPYPSTTWRET